MDEITRIRHKRLAGEPLTEAEQAVQREYFRKYNPTRISVSTKVAMKSAWSDAAKHQGLTLSAWVVEQVERAQMPIAPEVEAAKQEAQVAKDQIVALRKMLSELAAENGALHDQLRMLETSLATAVNRFPAILDALQHPERRRPFA
jgi:hypothetical protein